MASALARLADALRGRLAYFDRQRFSRDLLASPGPPARSKPALAGMMRAVPIGLPARCEFSLANGSMACFFEFPYQKGGSRNGDSTAMSGHAISRAVLRPAAALLLLLAAALLLVPAPPAEPILTWDDLIAPLGVGRPVTRGYVLSPPRRGEANDVVYVARRRSGAAGHAGRVEVHVLDRGRWAGVFETRSFAIGYEAPRPGAPIASSPEDAQAVTEALAQAISNNDTGFLSVAAIPLPGEPEPPTITRVLERLSGMRGALIGILAGAALIVLVAAPGGPFAVAIVLVGLGLALRAPSLDVPFLHDQDVQRLLTGNLPLREIATGMGLRDRHPPLYFFILHFAQRFGQSETVGRALAVFAGALVGPALLFGAALLRGRVGPTAALGAFAATISPELVRRSREVSEIPLYGLIVIAAAASLVAAARDPRATRLAAVALSHGLALFTYYLAPFIAAAHAAVLARLRPGRRLVGAFSCGILLGAPALALGAVTLVRDWGARETARAFPGLAWGEHSPVEMLSLLGRIVAEALGLPVLALGLGAIGVGAARRDVGVIVPALGTAATAAGIALLSPIARVQGYYVTAVLPLAVLALAAAPEPQRSGWRAVWLAGLVLAIASSTVPLLSAARFLYVADAGAFMPRFAAEIARRPEETVVTVAHYDKTLLAYYLARADGRPISWYNLDDPRAKRIEGLVLVHAMDAGSEEAAARRLEQIVAGGPTLVIERDEFLLRRISERLDDCEQLLQAPTARLLRCTAWDSR